MIRCFVVAAFMIAATSGCVTNNGDSSSSGTPAADAGSVCEATGRTCADCVTCAEMGPCATAYNTCMEDTYCTYLKSCLESCATLDCKSGCADPNSDPSNYAALSSCQYCTECPVACAGFATCK